MRRREPSGRPALSMTRAPRWATLVATFFGVGLLASGAGDLGIGGDGGFVVAGELAGSLRSGSISAACVLAALAVAVGIPAATQVCARPAG